LRDGTGANTVHYHPVLVERGSPRAGPAAQEVWDAVIAGTFKLDGESELGETAEIVATSETVASDVCHAVYDLTLKTHRSRCQEDERRHADSVRARRNAIQVVGLAEVRQHRLRKLEVEQVAWVSGHARRLQAHPILEPLVFLDVRGGGA